MFKGVHFLFILFPFLFNPALADTVKINEKLSNIANPILTPEKIKGHALC